MGHQKAANQSCLKKDSTKSETNDLTRIYSNKPVKLLKISLSVRLLKNPV